MKKISVISFTSLLLLFSLHNSCMNNNSIQFALSIPEITKLIAYAIVDTADSKPNSHKEALIALRNFSFCNKKAHEIIYNLRCGSDKESEKFNNHLIIHVAKSLHDKFNPECLAAAYVGTPIALTIVKKYYDTNTMNEFKKCLDAKSITIYHDSPRACFDEKVLFLYEVHPEIRNEYEPILETLSKFPLSTYHFCFGELFRKKD